MIPFSLLSSGVSGMWSGGWFRYVSFLGEVQKSRGEDPDPDPDPVIFGPPDPDPVLFQQIRIRILPVTMDL